MTTEIGGEAGLPGHGNLWDGDADSEGVRYLSQVAAQFALYAREHMRWIQEDPLAGKDAETQLSLGQQLEFVGQAMQNQGQRRAQLMREHGDLVLLYLAALPREERAGVDAIAREVGGAPESVVLVLDDLARAESVHVWRPRPRRIGDPREPTLYAVSVKGRLRLERSAVMASSRRRAIGASKPEEQ